MTRILLFVIILIFSHIILSWAFAAIACVESQLFLKTGQLNDLSEQQLVDCVTDNLGCKGGDATITYSYLMHNSIRLEADYPYQSKQGECKKSFNETDNPMVLGFAILSRNDEDALKRAVAEIGPIEVSISFIHEKFMRYSEGVYFDLECNDGITNHAVAVVGFGYDQRSKLDYWIVKNSWAENWGENGFIRIARNKDNHCGIASHGIFPFLTESEKFQTLESLKNEANENVNETYFGVKTLMVLGMICVSSLMICMLFGYLIMNSKDDENDVEQNELKEFVDFNGHCDNTV